jgi:site-specific recombinase XerD
MLKVSDVLLEQKLVRVRSEVAKNQKERLVPLTPELVDDFMRLGVDKAIADHYLFSEKLCPGKNKISDAYMRKYWDKMRKRLNLSENMVLYSLRDSGMTDMIKNGIDPLSVKQLADHHSLEMTAIYTNHVDPNLQKLIYEHAPKFVNS